MFEYLKNKTIYRNKYQTHPEAMIVSCYFNPMNSEYRTKAFNTYYNSIKHLNHTIIEGVIGNSKPELPETQNIQRVHTPNLLWHKESLLNKAIKDLPEKYKYIFWVDADVIFNNKNWLVEGVNQLKTNNIIQPFEHCVHMDQDQEQPGFSMEELRTLKNPNQHNSKVWRSFAANYASSDMWQDLNYHNHGHVGFAWAARREVLDEVPLYDRALIGGADHIMAHAAAGQIDHNCIRKSFTEDIDAVNQWSKKFHAVTQGKMGYVAGDLYHIWHGDIEKRDYFNRIRQFTAKSKNITERDQNGLYKTNNENETFMQDYFKRREVTEETKKDDMDLIKGLNLFYNILTSSDDTPAKPEPENNFDGFGGGKFGGAGAGDSYDTDPVQNDVRENVGDIGNDSSPGAAAGAAAGIGGAMLFMDNMAQDTDSTSTQQNNDYTPFS